MASYILILSTEVIVVICQIVKDSVVPCSTLFSRQIAAIQGMRGVGPNRVRKLFVPFSNLFIRQLRSHEAVDQDEHSGMAAVQRRFAQSRRIKPRSRSRLSNVSLDLEL